MSIFGPTGNFVWDFLFPPMPKECRPDWQAEKRQREEDAARNARPLGNVEVITKEETDDNDGDG